MKNSDFGITKQYMTRDGKPWFPVMGEMHYSRYREELWEESLHKMKAAGVQIVSSYLIWIHHEEIEGEFDFTGCRNLHHFMECCRKVGIYSFLRVGPWVHGECRNGGFPDWLQKKEGIELRSDDPGYLHYVERYWKQLYEQVKGFLYKDGGPVIGLQIENEYGHVGGFTGEKGEQHMRTLQRMAKEIGFDVPLYTATGWGGAVIGDCIPVMGGYCDAPWDPSVKELSANTNFVFSHERNDALIACDHHVEDAVTFDEASFPYLTAELGGGLQVTAHRRPVATGSDIGAMSLVKMGSGAGLLGYYMYHGGSNPDGKLTTLQESKATGYANDLPEINYDFNAPIRQYGTISDSLKEIKLLAYFLQDFGEDMAALPAEIQDEKIKPEDLQTLRVSCRHDETHGYVFFNNYQRRRTMAEHKQVILKGSCGGDTETDYVTFPAFDLHSGELGFFPYRMKLGEAVLKSALAAPLCRLRWGEQETYVFYGDRKPFYEWETEEHADILHLTRKEALNAWYVTTDQDYLILSDNYVWEQDGEIHFAVAPGQKILSCPALKSIPKGMKEEGTEGRFHIYRMEEQKAPAQIHLAEWDDVTAAPAGEAGMAEETAGIAADTTSAAGNCPDKPDNRKYQVTVSYDKLLDRKKGEDLLLYITYDGNGMEIEIEGKKVNDYFYTGQQAVFSLGYFDFPKELTITVQPLKEGAPVFLEKLPEFQNGTACQIREIQTVYQEEVRA